MYTRGYLHSIINVEQIIKRMEKIAIGAWVILILILTGGIVIAPIAILVGLGIILLVYKYRPEWCATDKEEYHRIKKERLERESKESE